MIRYFKVLLFNSLGGINRFRLITGYIGNVFTKTQILFRMQIESAKSV